MYGDQMPPIDPQTAAMMQPGANVMGAPTAPVAPGQLDPALVKQLLALNAQGPQADKAKRQLALADKLRGGAPAMARSQSPINTPNVMGALATALAGYKANQLEQGAQGTLDALAQERQKVYGQYAEGLGM